MIFSVRVSDEAGNLIKAYTAQKGITVSKFLRSAVYEHLDHEQTLIPEEMEVIREKTLYDSKSDI